MFFLFLFSIQFHANPDTSASVQMIAIDSLVSHINADSSLSIFSVLGDAGFGAFTADVFYKKSNNEILKIKSHWKNTTVKNILFFFRDNKIVYFIRNSKPFYYIEESAIYDNKRSLVNPEGQRKLVAAGYFINETTCTLLKLQ